MGKYKFCLSILIVCVLILFLTSITNAGSPTYTVTGKVFNDANCNHVKELGEVGIQGAKITLTNKYDPSATYPTATTDGSGSYTFTGLPKNIAYDVEEKNAPGYYDSTPNKYTVDTQGKKVLHLNFGDSLIDCSLLPPPPPPFLQ